MIVLLSCSTNLLASENTTISSTGGEDSILISYDDLRRANAKLIELEYEKSINEHLRNVIYNDSIAIDGLRTGINRININAELRIKQIKRERNIMGGIGLGSLILLIISIL